MPPPAFSRKSMISALVPARAVIALTMVDGHSCGSTNPSNRRYPTFPSSGSAADHAPASRGVDTDIVQRNVHAEREKVPAETTRIVWGHVDGPVRDHGAVAESSHEFNVPRLIHRGAENVNPA